MSEALSTATIFLVDEDGDPLFVKILDFGIAKVADDEGTNLTQTGMILGTPYYMSPEQARGEKVDGRSDIYSLGIMMYRAFTGRLPFEAGTNVGVITKHISVNPEPPSVHVPVDAQVEEIILRCMEKDVTRRPQTMKELAAWLAAVEHPEPEHPTEQTPPPSFPTEAAPSTIRDVSVRPETLLSAVPQQTTPAGIVVPHRALERRYQRSVGLGPVLFGTMVLIASVAAFGIRLTRNQVAHTLEAGFGAEQLARVRVQAKAQAVVDPSSGTTPANADPGASEPSARPIPTLPTRVPGPLPKPEVTAQPTASALPVGLRNPFGDP